ncbi:hypothetical protein FALBO_3672 [Fusarium albosuccineum]|uniref:Uncharacterized protein n=1 Tax=Fusarium albosuccineum TaxID=1237068 RepID=A0A8H4LKA5_9HYPO|nr:hypothetical protein FALBO_3672 [Fusarium albosuccineum]
MDNTQSPAVLSEGTRVRSWLEYRSKPYRGNIGEPRRDLDVEDDCGVGILDLDSESRRELVMISRSPFLEKTHEGNVDRNWDAELDDMEPTSDHIVTYAHMDWVVLTVTSTDWSETVKLGPDRPARVNVSRDAAQD